MKANKGFMQVLLVGAFAFLTFSLSSCSKQEYDGAGVTISENSQQKIVRQIRSLKYNLRSPNGKVVITSNGDAGGVSFQSGSTTTNFAGDNGSANFAGDPGSTNYAGDPGSANYSSGSSGNSFDLSGSLVAGGGSVSIGSKNITLDYVFCSESDSDLFDMSDFNGEDFKILIGIAGDFKDPENAKLNYMVFMVMVGDGSAGSYKLDLDLLSMEEPKGKFGIIEILDFSKLKQDGGFENMEDATLYISTKGSLSASSGAYVYSAADMAEIKFSQGGDFNFGKIVKGSGNLLCQ